MFASIVLVGFLALGAFGAPHDGSRVVGGKPAKLGQIPYIISLKSYGSHICGGSILDKRHVLTAAHCVAGSSPNGMSIQYGVIDSDADENRINVKKIAAHPNYNPSDDYGNDVAVLTLAEDIEFSDNAKPTKLPAGPIEIEEESITSRLSGWGYTANGGVQKYLLTATFPLFNNEICEQKLLGYQAKYHFCAGDLDGSHKQCSGDSGGPLVDEATGTQMGIVSWSYKPCTVRDRPGVFTRLPNYVDWVKQQMESY